MLRKNENRRKNAERRQKKLNQVQNAMGEIRAPIGSDAYIEQIEAVFTKNKLSNARLKAEYHIPSVVELPELPKLSVSQQRLLGKAMLENLLGFNLTEKEYQAAKAKTSLSEWCDYGYTLYVAMYDRLRDLARHPTRVKDEQQKLTLRAGLETSEARAEVNQYLNDKTSDIGLYGEHFRQYGDAGPALFLIAMPKPLAGKILLLAIAHMLDSLTQVVLQESAVNAKLENVSVGRCAPGDLGHMLFAYSPLNEIVRVLTIPTLPQEFISEFNTMVQMLPAELRVGNQENECRLYPIYEQFYNHLSGIKAKHGMGYHLVNEDLSRLDRLPLSHFFLEEMFQAFFAILEAAKKHLLPSDEEIIAAHAKVLSSAVSSSSAHNSSSADNSSSVLPSGVSAGQLAAGYTRARSPTPSKEEEKADSTAEITFRK